MISTAQPLPRPSNRASLVIWSVVATLLLLPAVAMQFTTEVRWTSFDFVSWGTMLMATAGGFELLVRQAPNWTYRAGATVALGAAFLLVWVSLAVGIIGSERDRANMMYAGVLIIAAGGACVGRFRSDRMARTMLAAAVAQVAVGAIALLGGLGAEAQSWPRDVIGATGAFAAAWLLAAWLFRRAA